MDDLNGDGFGDLIIGRQNFTPAAGRDAAGALTILFGSPAWREQAGQLVDLLDLPPGMASLTLTGANAYDRLGIWMRCGDLDGDGIAELVVGADQEDAPNEANRGAAYVLRGGSDLSQIGTTTNLFDLGRFGNLPDLNGRILRLLPPDGAGNWHFGGTVQIGDLDGNGRGLAQRQIDALYRLQQAPALPFPVNPFERMLRGTGGPMFFMISPAMPFRCIASVSRVLSSLRSST